MTALAGSVSHIKQLHMKRCHLHYLYIVSWSKEKSTILLKIKRLTQALVLSWNDTSLSEKQFGSWGAGTHILIGRKGGLTVWQPHKQGKWGDLAGRASEGSSVRPVWGRRHFQRKKWCMALSGQLSKTGTLANKLRWYPACSMTMSSADLSAVEEAQQESRSTVFRMSCGQQYREAAVPFLRMKTGSVLDTTLQRMYLCPQKTSVDLPTQIPNSDVTTPWEACVCLYRLIPEVQFRGKGTEYHQ